MKRYGITFIAESQEFEKIKAAIHEKYPDAKIEVCPGYEYTSLKRYGVSFSMGDSITKSVAKATELRDLIIKARKEAARSVEIQ